MTALYYLAYFLKKEDRHSLQSPFAYQLYQGLMHHRKTSHYPEIEALRQSFLQDNTLLEIRDFGAGSKKLKVAGRRVKDVAKYSNSKKKHNLLYQYFLSKTPALNAIELGSGLGINTRYLAEACKGKLYSFEADPGLYSLAAGHLSPFQQVEIRQENIDEGLPQLLQSLSEVDFALLDANHTYEATTRYFHLLLPFLREESIVIIGDIYWSKGMKNAWNEIKTHPMVQVSFDFFECGVLFFRKNVQPGHYILTY